jgi:hypothetical protein
MKKVTWNLAKARLLKANADRGHVSFEDCLEAIDEGRILDVVANPSINHPTQRIFVLDINGYAYCAPSVESETEIFLKTVFPSRRMTAIYLKV